MLLPQVPLQEFGDPVLVGVGVGVAVAQVQVVSLGQEGFMQ